MSDPEIINNNLADGGENDLEAKKQKLRDYYAADEGDLFRSTANNDSFWEKVSPENVDSLLADYEELLELRKEAEAYKKKQELDQRIGKAAVESKPSVDPATDTIERKSEFDAHLIERGKEIVLESPQTFISVDIEADGVAGYGSMLSIGAVSPNGEKFYSEIRPISEDYIKENFQFTESHGLERERLLKEAPSDSEVMHKFLEWVENATKNNHDKKPVFTAFNAAFDFSFVDLYFKKNGIKNPFGIAPFDLKSLAMSSASMNKEFDWSKTKKQNLPGRILPDDEFTHNALDDAVYQQTLMYGLVALDREKTD